MNKKIICILISGIFLMAMFSSINNICKAEPIAEKKDAVSKIEPMPLQMNNMYYVIAYGDFYVEDDCVKGHANIAIGFIIPLPIPFIWRDVDISFAIHNPNYDVWKCKYSEHMVSLFYVVPK